MVLGGLEISSIAMGFKVLDTTVKTAMVEILLARPVCPGKFLILMTGDVASVTASVSAGEEMGEGFLIDSLVIPNLHSEVEGVILEGKKRFQLEAVAMVESYSALSSIRGADVACKVSEVKLARLHLAYDIGGKSFFMISGSIENVEASSSAASVPEKKKGFLCRSIVIPRPHPDIQGYLEDSFKGLSGIEFGHASFKG